MFCELLRLRTCPSVIARNGLTSLTKTWLSAIATNVHFTSGFVCWKRNSHSNIPSSIRGSGTEWIQCDSAAKKNCIKSDGWFVPEAWKNRFQKILNVNLSLKQKHSPKYVFWILPNSHITNLNLKRIILNAW